MSPQIKNDQDEYDDRRWTVDNSVTHDKSEVDEEEKLAGYQHVHFTSYHSFTDLMENDIRTLDELQQSLKLSQAKEFKQFLNNYQSISNKFFGDLFQRDFGADSFCQIFTEDCFNFQERKVDEIIKANENIPEEQKKVTLQYLASSYKLFGFLNIVIKGLPNQISFQLIYLSYLACKTMVQVPKQKKIDFKALSQDIYYMKQFRYLNLKSSCKETLTSDIKQSFLNFTVEFMILINKIVDMETLKTPESLTNKQPKFIGLKRFGLYESKQDFLDSESDQKEEQFFCTKKKRHLCDNQ